MSLFPSFAPELASDLARLVLQDPQNDPLMSTRPTASEWADPESVPVQQPMINSLPMEMLVEILKQNIPTQELLFLRAVCRHWQNTIEYMIQPTRSLLLSNEPVDPSSPDQYRTAQNRFFDVPRASNFCQIRLRSQTAPIAVYFSKEFCALLQRLFPNIKECLISGVALHKDSVPNLLYLLTNWPNDATISYSFNIGAFRPHCKSQFRSIGHLRYEGNLVSLGPNRPQLNLLATEAHAHDLLSWSRNHPTFASLITHLRIGIADIVSFDRLSQSFRRHFQLLRTLSISTPFDTKNKLVISNCETCPKIIK